jgi:hypothetical protein
MFSGKTERRCFMQKPVDLSFMDEAAEEDPAELLEALPAIRQEVAPARVEDDLGLRSLLERPEAFAHAWWRDQASRSGSSIRAMRRPAPWRAA